MTGRLNDIATAVLPVTAVLSMVSEYHHPLLMPPMAEYQAKAGVGVGIPFRHFEKLDASNQRYQEKHTSITRSQNVHVAPVRI